MAITISNPLLMNRMSKRQARAHAKSMPRGRNGRFLKKGRKGAAARRGKSMSKSRSRTKNLRKGRKGAAGRRMTARQVQALARKHGLVAKVHRKDRKRKMTDEQKAKLAAGRAAYNEKRRRASATKRHTSLLKSAADIKAAGGQVGYLPATSPEMFGARYSSAAEMAAAGVERAYENRGRRNRRNGRNRRNPALYGTVESALRGLPVVGKFTSAALLGATAAVVHYGAAKGVKALAARSSAVDSVVDFVAPVGFTVMGASVQYALPMLLNLVSRLPLGDKVVGLVDMVISPADLANVGQVATVAGAVLDVYRAFKGTSSEFGTIEMGGLAYGDGTAYEVVPYGTIEMGGLSYGTIEMGGLAYGAAEMADAAYCNDDLSGEEAAAAKAGAGQYMARFPMMNAARATRVAGRPSSMAGKHGLRWGWLIKLVGWEKFQQIASLSPGHRVRVIAALRMQAMQSLQSTIDKTALALPALQSPVTSDLSGLNYSGLAYGGFVYAGEGM